FWSTARISARCSNASLPAKTCRRKTCRRKTCRRIVLMLRAISFGSWSALPPRRNEMNPGPAAEAAKVLVVMGVSGSGKNTIASMLAQRLYWIYEDGDWFHPKSNLEKMHHG